ncbi:putative RNA-binding protein [Rubidibacter lacunae KORDI 51-2]|uniref:Rqc2 homolog RqcH n=1 Tax=Rubidibacter lacunae KORDI 51-2 TaxID=582515 RepID=U5DKI6_9CHRO|nr:NFACT RNA binding domain-containing protein [Rubidibacter lacunae]ERN40220.1 putative RNA-binding protein [Rubidibacter lacunae KORDI 51-2]
MQGVDFTTLSAVLVELRAGWLPARAEQVYQRDRHTLSLALRTLRGRDWLTISWHPQAARLHVGEPPPRTPDTFAFSEQLRHQVNGLALVDIATIAPWERVVDLQFAPRPGDAVLWHLYVEIVGKYSNTVLVDAGGNVVTVAHQVSPEQSRLRPVLTGQPYEPPPPLTGTVPTGEEAFTDWRDRVRLVPGKLWKQLLKSYRGVGPTLARSLSAAVGIDADRSTDDLHDGEWHLLYERWHEWLSALENKTFVPGWTDGGYTVLGWNCVAPEQSVQTLLQSYYGRILERQVFTQLHQQLLQKVKNATTKIEQKIRRFEERLQQSNDADSYRERADLLMAYLHEWQPGMTAIALPDFATGKPVEIAIDPEKNAVQNAQALYKRHQKLKRARTAIEPLLQDVRAEADYLGRVEAALARLDCYTTPDDLQALEEIRAELIQENYLISPRDRRRNSGDADNLTEAQPLRYRAPSGCELLVGRNNRQNDRLSFRTAVEYDLWFHAQEIPGSHVLLRLAPGAVPDDADLQFAADLAAFHSRARQGDRVPVIYTEPKHVFKPKGALPGTAIYSHERVLWGSPQAIARNPSGEVMP